MEDILMNVKEVSQYLKLHRQTIYRMVDDGRLPSVRVGGAIRFKKSEIDLFISHQKHLKS